MKKQKTSKYDLDKLIRATPKEKLEAMVHGIAVALWLDGHFFDPNKEWSPDELESIGDLMEPFRPRRRTRDRSRRSS